MRILFNVHHPSFGSIVEFWDKADSLPEIDNVYSISVYSEDNTQSKSSFKVQFITQKTDENGFFYVVSMIPIDSLIN